MIKCKNNTINNDEQIKAHWLYSQLFVVFLYIKYGKTIETFLNHRWVIVVLNNIVNIYFIPNLKIITIRLKVCGGGGEVDISPPLPPSSVSLA